MAGTTPLSPQSGAQLRVTRMEQQLQQIQADQGTFATQMNTEMLQSRNRMLAIETTIRDREEAIRTAFDTTAAQRAAELASVVSDARSEFDKQRQLLQDITNAVQVEFHKLQQQVDQSSTREGGSRGGKSFLPVKELKPPKLCKEEQWRDWSEHFAEYLEASCSGMKDCLKKTATAEAKPDQEAVAISEFSHLADRAEALYSALKHLTEDGSAARRVITSTPKEDGFAAW